MYKINDTLVLKQLTRLRVNFSQLREHKFSHNFLDKINPLCSCCLKIESINHYLLRCSFHTCIRKTSLENITAIIWPISDISDDKLVNLLLFGNNVYSVEQNSSVLKNTIIFLKSSERFNILLLKIFTHMTNLDTPSFFLFCLFVCFHFIIILFI